MLGGKQMRSIVPRRVQRVQNHLLSAAQFASPTGSRDTKLPLAQSSPQNVLCLKPKLILVPRSKNNICLPKRSPCSSWLRILIKASAGEDQWEQGAHKVILPLVIVYKSITAVLCRAQGQSWPPHNSCSPPLLLNCIKQNLAISSPCPECFSCVTLCSSCWRKRISAMIINLTQWIQWHTSKEVMTILHIYLQINSGCFSFPSPFEATCQQKHEFCE